MATASLQKHLRILWYIKAPNGNTSLCFPFLPLLQEIPLMALILCCLDASRNSPPRALLFKITVLETITLSLFTWLKNAKVTFIEMSHKFSLLFPGKTNKQKTTNNNIKKIRWKQIQQYLNYLSGLSFPKSVSVQHHSWHISSVFSGKRYISLFIYIWLLCLSKIQTLL